jgi:uncharacterized repeat protein (TIGR03803 family)
MKNILKNFLQSCLVAITLASLLLTTPRAQAQTFTVLYAFTGGTDGGKPYASLVRDAADNLYGTTAYGGAPGFGIVFKLDAAGNETVLHSFTGQPDGDSPLGALIRDTAGNLYGTTFRGGNFDRGTIFKVDAAGNETVLHSFAGPDGRQPLGGLIRDNAGNLYGVTFYGGKFDLGTVFKLDAPGNETVLYNFKGGTDGWYPEARLLQDSGGNLYGTTPFGGNFNCGTVFKLDLTRNETVLYSFTAGADGGFPSAGLIEGAAGNFYGTTPSGGAFSYGTVFKLKLNTSGTRGFVSVLHTFKGADGAVPYAGLIRDAQNNLYGTTRSAGAFSYGTVFKLDATDKETVLHSFTGADGSDPVGGLILDAAGNLYGTTYEGGPYDAGTVFKITP